MEGKSKINDTYKLYIKSNNFWASMETFIPTLSAAFILSLIASLTRLPILPWSSSGRFGRPPFDKEMILKFALDKWFKFTTFTS